MFGNAWLYMPEGVICPATRILIDWERITDDLLVYSTTNGIERMMELRGRMPIDGKRIEVDLTYS